MTVFSVLLTGTSDNQVIGEPGNFRGQIVNAEVLTFFKILLARLTMTSS